MFSKIPAILTSLTVFLHAVLGCFCCCGFVSFDADSQSQSAIVDGHEDHHHLHHHDHQAHSENQEPQHDHHDHCCSACEDLLWWKTVNSETDRSAIVAQWDLQNDTVCSISAPMSSRINCYDLPESPHVCLYAHIAVWMI